MSMSSYKPFPITEQKTGLTDYLQPWIRPQDAWEPLENANIYRGTLNKRAGYSEFGRMAYRDNGVKVATGDGGPVYSGTIPVRPFRKGSVTIVTEAAGPGALMVAQDNGLGTFIGDVAIGGVIDYVTGNFTLTFTSNVTIGVFIYAGFSYVPTLTTVPAPVGRRIMGLKNWNNESTDVIKFVALDTKRASVYNTGTGVFDPISTVLQVIWEGDGVTSPIAIDTGWKNLAPFSLTLTDGVTTVRDNGLGVLVKTGGGALPDGVFTAGTVNYATGIIGVTFTGGFLAVGASITATFNLAGDYFSGLYNNFFNATDWQGFLYLTNNVDRITRFNGTVLDRPPFGITLAHKNTFINDITTCLDLDVYKNRLLLQRPTVNGVVDAQSIRYSAINVPTNIAADVTGNGGEISAPTDDFLQASEFLRDQLVVFFTNSTFMFRFTGSPFIPFQFDKINVTKSCNSPYSSVAYDDRVTAIGKKGLIYCDGTTTARYDNAVIDNYKDINQEFYQLCYSQRNDAQNQTWMLYPSSDEVFTGDPFSDKIFVYNFLENTWATYLIPMSCLGLYLVQSDATWADFAPGGKWFDEYPTWADCDFPWDEFLQQRDALSVMGGGLDGVIYEMDVGIQDRDPPGFTIPVNCTSTRWNPFIKEGQKAQFGYIDIYYQKQNNTFLTLTFYTDNSNVPATTKTLFLDGPKNVDSAIKRVYVNVTGEFLQMNISSATGPFKINGLVLWARPGGRLFP